jgi:hypothetical protein
MHLDDVVLFKLRGACPDEYQGHSLQRLVRLSAKKVRYPLSMKIYKKRLLDFLFVQQNKLHTKEIITC